MVAEKGKKAKTGGDAELDDSSQLVIAVEKLQEVQDELEKINEEESDKVLEVEQKYNQIKRPFYVKRNDVIQSIPDFWLTAFLCHPMLGELLNEEDHKVFKYLHSIDVEDLKDVKSGFSVSFIFNPNPFFEDSKLTKSFTYSDDGTTNITRTTIKWKDGQDIANGNHPEKKGKKRPSSHESFFKWFNSNQQESLPEDNFDEIFEIIKDDLWPNPLKYFNNEGDDEDTDGDGVEGEDGNEGGSDDEDDNDADEDEEEDEEN